MRLIWTTAFCLALLAGPANAQNFDDLFKVDKEESSFQVGGAKEAKVSATLKKGTKKGVVIFELKLTIPEGANSYSQAKDFAKPTVIKLSGIDGWTALDNGFKPNPKPKRAFDEVFGKEVEKLIGTTTFTRRYLAPQDKDIEDAKFTGKIDLLLCDKGSCTPKSIKFTATLTDAKKAEANAVSEVSPLPEPPAEVTVVEAVTDSATTTEEGTTNSPSEFTYGYAITPQRKIGGELKDDPVQIQFEMGPADAKVGEIVTVAITMTIDDNWSTYGLEKADETQLERPTEIKFQTTNLSPVGEIISAPPPVLHETDLGDETLRSNAHEKQVTWLQKFRVESADSYSAKGLFKYQICENHTQCLAQKRIPFSLGTEQQQDHTTGAVAVTESFLNPPEELLASHSPEASTGSESGFKKSEEASVSTVWGAIGLAFLTGLIMNIMPCVLPVLAIKVLSLVQQAGESRAKIIGLNFAYTAGVLAVFFAFAIMAWGLGQSLATVFQSTAFWIVMSCVVFTMGLSLFGVFELPVPGLIPSANDHQEGYFGAFNTGIIATLLGIPCIGPFVVPFFTWTLKQPGPIVFLVFGMMGIGMASPYLMTGIFPALVNWLPRPGMWMVRFKQFTGFVLMGTVIWLMFSIPSDARLPTLILFLAIGLLVWMLHNLTDPTKSARKQWKTYLASVGVSIPIFFFGLALMMHEPKIEWEPFSKSRMVELRQEGVPMLIDFTADWCAVCKWNEAFALDTDEAASFVEKNNFVPMIADFTHEDPEIQELLKHFGQDSVPLTVIVPPGADSELIFLRGRVTKPDLLSKLNEAMRANPNGVTMKSQKTARNSSIRESSIN